MENIVVVAEKPDIARAVAKVLPGSASKKTGYIEAGCYKVTWCYGHLLRLKAPEDYSEKYQRKNTPNEVLPIFFENWEKKIDDNKDSILKDGRKAPSKKAQLEIIGQLLKKATLVIVAGDIDDEGQLLVEEVLDWHHYSGPIKRLDTGALNEASLRKAMKNLQDNGPWHMRAVSAQARSVADFALGINGSRFFSNTYKANLSVGRVQTAALGLVVDRDKLIESHTAMKYYLLDMDAEISQHGIHTVRFVPKDDLPQLTDGKIMDKVFLQRLGDSMNKGKGTVSVKKEKVKEDPPLPFSISALKSYCASKFNITPEETLAITQSLRMNHGGLITYNRSECRYIPENMHADAPAVIGAVLENLGYANKGLPIDTSLKSKAFDDKYTSVHHAIIPTGQRADLSKLTENERKVYTAVCLLYMVQFMPCAEKERTRASVACAEGTFSASSLRVTKKGFKSILATKTTEAETPLSDVPPGEYPCILSKPVISDKETIPPKRYTDSSLEEDMKSVAKYVTDPTAKRLLLLKDHGSKEEHGSIGTAATRSAIIHTLKKRGFLVNDGKKLVSTPLGRKFYDILPDEIRKPDLTAKWWAIEQEIAEGKSQPDILYKEVLDSYARFSSYKYPEIRLDSTEDKKSIGACPVCGKPVIVGSKGYSCSGWKTGSCKFTIWKTGKVGAYKVLSHSGKTVTEAMARKLLKKQKVLVKGLVSERTGNKYDAYVRLEQVDDRFYLNLNFEDLPAANANEKGRKK